MMGARRAGGALLLLLLPLLSAAAAAAVAARAPVLVAKVVANEVVSPCSGALVGRSTVLVPASCVLDRARALLAPAHQLRVVLGALTTVGMAPSDNRLVPVTRVVSHTAWTGAEAHNVAILSLTHCQSPQSVADVRALKAADLSLPDAAASAADFAWAASQAAADPCPSQPLSSAPLPTAVPVDASVMVAPIVLNANTTAALSSQAKAAAVEIVKEAQVKARLMYNNAMKRRARGNPKAASSQLPAAAPPSVLTAALPDLEPRDARSNVLVAVQPANPNCPSAVCAPETPAPTEHPGYLDVKLPKPEKKPMNLDALGLHNRLDIRPETHRESEKLLTKLHHFHRKVVRRMESLCSGPICPLHRHS